MYCPRRFALLEINRDWSENAYVVKANILHENVHDGSHGFSDSKKVVHSSVAVYNDLSEYDLYGITDCIEFVKGKDGVKINGLDGLYKIKIVEYKPKAPKTGSFNETDAIQVFAQKICADYVFDCSSEAYLYYADTRKRVRLPFDEKYGKYDALLKELLIKMRCVLSQDKIPPRIKGQKCSGCSISDICFPKDKQYSVRKLVMEMKGADVL